MKAVRPVIASNEVTSLQMRLVGSHSRPKKEKGGKKERVTGTERGRIEVHSYFFNAVKKRYKIHTNSPFSV